MFQKRKGELILLLITMIWGGTFLFTKNGLNSVSPFIFIIFRFSIALVLTIIFFNKKLLSINSTIAKQGFILGVYFGSGFMLQTYALAYTTITKTAFITGLTGAFVPIAYRIVQKRYINKLQALGIFLSLVGLYVFTDPKLENLNIGDLLTLCSTFFWAFYLTTMDLYTKEVESIDKTAQLVFMQFVGALPVTLVGLFISTGAELKFAINNDLLIALAYNGIIASFVLTLIQTNYQKLVTPIKAALIYSLEPVFATLIAFVFLNEFMKTREVYGALLLMSGVVVPDIIKELKKFKAQN